MGKFPQKWERSHKNRKVPIKMRKFPLLLNTSPLSKGKIYLNSHKNEKIPIRMGKYPFIAEHVAFVKKESFL